MPHRSRLKAVAAGVLVLAIITACSGGSTLGGTTSTHGANTLHVAFFGDISTPNPDTAYDGPELNLVDSAYEGLLDYAPGQQKPQLVGKLATSWKANPDNTQFTFTLRDGVTFHDGTPFDSSAVKASFDRRHAVGQGPAYMVDDVKSVETPSPTQVVVTLTEPNSAFLDLLASPFGPKMISPAALAAHPVTPEGADWFDTHDAGTGPYGYGTFVQGVSYELQANDHYWAAKPAYTTVKFAVLSSMSTIQLQLEQGSIDALIGYTDNVSFADYQANKKLATYAFPSMQTTMLMVNPASPALSDAAVRHRFLSGIDFPTLTRSALGGTAEVTDEVFAKGLVPSNLNQQVIPHDADALANLASGPLAGKTVRLAYAQNSGAAKALSDNLTAILNTAGIKATSTSLDVGTYYDELKKGADAPDITFYAGFPDTAHPGAWGSVFYAPTGGLNLFGANVTGLADVLAAARRTDDLALYGQAARMVSESGYWYSVATSKATVVAQPGVAGIDGAWHPVITGVLALNLLHPAGDK
ncbi:MAG TPA: ABC transporter substrate-binding protein [Mycobacterium sp.]